MPFSHTVQCIQLNMGNPDSYLRARLKTKIPTQKEQGLSQSSPQPHSVFTTNYHKENAASALKQRSWFSHCWKCPHWKFFIVANAQLVTFSFFLFGTSAVTVLHRFPWNKSRFYYCVPLTSSGCTSQTEVLDSTAWGCRSVGRASDCKPPTRVRFPGAYLIVCVCVCVY